MSKRKSLSVAEREFLRLVAEAVSCNPFTPARRELDRRIGGASARATPSEAVKQAVAEVDRRLRALERESRADVRAYAEDDAQIVRAAVLFDVFHRCGPEFDEHVLSQAARGDEPVRVAFAARVMAELGSHGLGTEEAQRYFAKFHQIRRAYYLIDYAASGRSACMQALRARLWNNIFTHDTRFYDRFMWNRMEDFSTLLLGETGTGKGTAALAIGRSGYIPYDPRRGCFAESFNAAFLAMNLSQFPESLIESELFGHRKGAFTGAIDDYIGLFSRCSPNGAIFLDEIGDVGIPVQIKLLQVLQERAFSPVGSHERRRFQGRVIAATNKPLDDLRAGGRFREDFYYRLCSDEITVPPLRQRVQEEAAELEDLVRRILMRLCGEAAGDLVAFALESLAKSPGKDYAWPGNVRELEQAIRRILLKGSYESRRIERGLETELVSGLRGGTLTSQQLLSGYARMLYERHGTYEDVAQRTGLDWRTVKKHIEPA
ncbi:MAG: sigma-54-dependent Fis family transcriptional regulator [Kiritimatiellae bacterium]|nr:sigma-54-dependent Fis family transcriptional regulator [Kiritimatiellia bacterium]